MKSLITSIKKIHFVKLETDEDVIEVLSQYCKRNNITSGFIFGLGAVKRANLGYFDVKTKEYKSNSFSFYAEVLTSSHAEACEVSTSTERSRGLAKAQLATSPPV